MKNIQNEPDECVSCVLFTLFMHYFPIFASLQLKLYKDFHLLAFFVICLLCTAIKWDDSDRNEPFDSLHKKENFTSLLVLRLYRFAVISCVDQIADNAVVNWKALIMCNKQNKCETKWNEKMTKRGKKSQNCVHHARTHNWHKMKTRKLKILSLPSI